MIIRMNPEVSLSLEEMFLKNNKALKMLFKLIKRNLLCTLLYAKMPTMQGCLLGKTILAWSFQFISSPLKDPSKKNNNSKIGINPKGNKIKQEFKQQLSQVEPLSRQVDFP